MVGGPARAEPGPARVKPVFYQYCRPDAASAASAPFEMRSIAMAKNIKRRDGVYRVLNSAAGPRPARRYGRRWPDRLSARAMFNNIDNNLGCASGYSFDALVYSNRYSLPAICTQPGQRFPRMILIPSGKQDGVLLKSKCCYLEMIYGATTDAFVVKRRLAPLWPVAAFYTAGASVFRGWRHGSYQHYARSASAMRGFRCCLFCG